MTTVPYTKIYRILHWAIALSFALLLITIFLRMTWLNKDHVATIIKNYQVEINQQALSQDQLLSLAKKIRQPMWVWHIYLGYVLSGLFVIRLTLPLLGTMKFQNPLSQGLSLKERFQKWVYLVFYSCVMVSLITGLYLKFGSKDWKDSMESIHVLSLYYLIPFIVIHLGGVFLAELTTDKGIISRIISGSKSKK